MNIRKTRIEQNIQNEIQQMILKELRDPRIGFCTITKVRLSEDYRFATVYASFLGAEDAVEKGMKGLQAASKFIQSTLAHRMNIKFTPYIRFIYDDSLEKGVSMIEKLKEIVPPETEEEDDDTSHESADKDEHTKTDL